MVTPPVHPGLEAELRRLGHAGVPAAEARRRIAPLAAQLGVARPGYTAVLLLVQESQPPVLVAEPGGPSALASLLAGRMPTPYELEATKDRALVHMRRRRARTRAE